MELSILELVFLGMLGIIAGWLNVMAGGGSLLTIPAMLFMDIPAPVANGTNRVGILFQNISAVYGFFRKGFSDFKLGFSLALCASIGAIFGASLGVQLNGKMFDILLAIVMIAVMLLMIKGEVKYQNKDVKPQRLLLGHICMIGAGFWGGMVQIGVGFILMPILNKVMKLDLVRTNMYKVFVVLVYTIIALGVFASSVQILWIVGLVLAVGSSIGGYLGAHISVSKGDKWIKIALYVTLSLFIVKLLFF